MYNRGLFRFVLQKDYLFLLKVKALLIKKGDAHCTDARGPTSESMEEITLYTGVVLMSLLSTTKLVRTCIFTIMKNILSPIVIVMIMACEREGPYCGQCLATSSFSEKKPKLAKNCIYFNRHGPACISLQNHSVSAVCDGVSRA